jgi:hypothetical protein
MVDATERFARFLDSIKDMDYPRIMWEAESACAGAEPARGPKAGRATRVEYAGLLKGFLFFMQHGIKPAGVSDEHFQLFRPVVENLVQKKQMLPEALKLFK